MNHDVVLECQGDIPGPRLLDGRTADLTVGLAPHVQLPFTGTRWRMRHRPEFGADVVTLQCLADTSHTWFLDGRTADGTVGLIASDGYTGTRWRLHDRAGLGDGMFVLECLGDIPGPKFLDGRTADGTVGLIASDGYTGTRWRRAEAQRAVLSTHNEWYLSWRSMAGDAYLTPQGQLRADITTESRSWFRGFVGGATVAVIDADENVIHMELTWPLGVDGRHTLQRSRRTDHPIWQIDGNVAARAARLELWLGHMPRSSWDQVIEQIGDKAGSLLRLVEDLLVQTPG
jgi:hypothetical protein